MTNTIKFITNISQEFHHETMFNLNKKLRKEKESQKETGEMWKRRVK
jgi:hypothetical protein